jgi:hypothetical protein
VLILRVKQNVFNFRSPLSTSEQYFKEQLGGVTLNKTHFWSSCYRHGELLSVIFWILCMPKLAPPIGRQRLAAGDALKLWRHAVSVGVLVTGCWFGV